MRCGRRSGTRSRRSSSRSARPRRSAATSTSSIARPGSGTARPRSRSRSRPSWRTRSPAGATSCSRRPPRPTTTSSTKYLEGEEIADAELEACLRKGVKESILAPVLVGSAVKGIGLRGPPRRDRPLPALARRRAAGDGRATRPATTIAVAGRSERAAPGPRLQDRRRPVRRPADLPARLLGHAPPPGPRLERRTAARTSGSASCCSARQGAGAVGELKAGEIGAVAKLAVTATGDTLELAGAAAHARPARVPGADAGGRDRAADEGRPRQDGRRRSSGCSRRSRARGSSAAETGEQILRAIGEAHVAVIVERLKRKFGAAIVTHTPTRPLPRDDPRQDPGRRAIQEADRRPRAVRRRLDRARAEPRRRRRVRREGRRRLGAQELLPGRREGHPRGRGRGRRSPATR